MLPATSASDTFTVNVVDTTAPTLAPIADQVFEATSASGAAAFFAATATDLVDGTAPVVFREGNTVVHSGDIFGFGTHTITASAVDAAGNQTSQNFKFNVVDTTAPTLTPIANQTREATSAAGAAAFFTATATDWWTALPLLSSEKAIRWSIPATTSLWAITPSQQAQPMLQAISLRRPSQSMCRIRQPRR